MITLVTADAAYSSTIKSIKDTNFYRDIQKQTYTSIDRAIKENKFLVHICIDDTISFDTAYPIMIALEDELSGLGYKTTLVGISTKKIELLVEWNKKK